MACSRPLTVVLALILASGAAMASDFPGHGEEADPGEGPKKAVEKRPATLETPSQVPHEVKVSEPLRPLSEYQTPVRAEALALPGPVRPLPPKSQPVPPRAEEPAPALLEGDLTADLPTAPKPKKHSPFWVVLEDFQAKGEVSKSAKEAFDQVAMMKKLVYKIAKDLDAGGKEKTRLIFSTESLSKAITETVEIWPRDENFRDVCRIAKSRVLVLEEELREEPRMWTHIRWAFQAVQKEVKHLRRATVAKAIDEPIPLRVTDKDGNVIIIEPSRDDRELAREHEEKKVERSEKELNQIKEEQQQDPGRRPLGTSE